MKILCWNINSLAPTVRNAVLKWGSYRGLFEEYEADIVCLQETKIRDDKLTKELCCVEGFQSFWAISRERKGYSGVVTYASTAYAPIACQADCLGSGEDDIDREGRVVITDHGHFVLVNVYCPNAGDRPDRPRLDFKIRFLRALKAKCDGLLALGREVMIVGDFNVAATPQDVHPTLKYEELYTPEEHGAFSELLRGYTDVWRRLHPDATDVYSVWDEYTGARAFNRGLRIDYFLVSPGLLSNMVSCEMVPTHPKWSDHTGMLLELRINPQVPAHPPCQQWSKLLRRFNDTSQPSVAAMFGRKKQPLKKGKMSDGSAAAGGRGGGGGGGGAAAAVAAAAATVPKAADAATGDPAVMGVAAEAGAAAASEMAVSERAASEMAVSADAAALAEAEASKPAAWEKRAPAGIAGHQGDGSTSVDAAGGGDARGAHSSAAGGEEEVEAAATLAATGAALPDGGPGGLPSCSAAQGDVDGPAAASKSRLEKQAVAGCGGGTGSGGNDRAGGRKRKAPAAPAEKQCRGKGGGRGGGPGRSIASFFLPPSKQE